MHSKISFAGKTLGVSFISALLLFSSCAKPPVVPQEQGALENISQTPPSTAQKRIRCDTGAAIQVTPKDIPLPKIGTYTNYAAPVSQKTAETLPITDEQRRDYGYPIAISAHGDGCDLVIAQSLLQLMRVPHGWSAADYGYDLGIEMASPDGDTRISSYITGFPTSTKKPFEVMREYYSKRLGKIDPTAKIEYFEMGNGFGFFYTGKYEWAPIGENVSGKAVQSIYTFIPYPDHPTVALALILDGFERDSYEQYAGFVFLLAQDQMAIPEGTDFFAQGKYVDAYIAREEKKN